MTHITSIVYRMLFISFIWGNLFFGSHAVAQEISEVIQDELNERFPKADSSGQSGNKETDNTWLLDVYKGSGFEPIWLEKDKLSDNGLVMVTALLNADLDGLDPEQYISKKITSAKRSRNPRKLAELDLALTEGFLKYSHDISRGRTRARLAFPELFPEAGATGFNPIASLIRAQSAEGLDTYFAALRPQHRYYQQLQDELVEYRKIAQLGGWPLIDAGPMLHAGETDSRVPLIRERLKLVGDLERDSDTGSKYDQSTVTAVMRFQFRHGLDADGIFGEATRAAMNVSASKRIEQLKLNLERWRWHDHKLGETYVLTNIAGFTLKAVKNGKLELEIPVIVGNLNHESPVFSDRIRYAEFNPYWTLPPRLARTETLISLRENPQYLEEKNIRVFSNWGRDAVEIDPATIDWKTISPQDMNSFKLRQDPGEWNALGTMKFIFPNKYSVYLHDTPNHDLFSASTRAFSHGCIRLSDPTALAGFLFDGQRGEWDRNRVDQIVKTGERTIVTLPERIPVHLTYLTAWHDEDGLLHFNEDIYGRDAKLMQALAEVNF